MICRAHIAAVGTALLLGGGACLPAMVCAPAMAQQLSSFEIAARARGTPDIPGLNIVWITPWGEREDANLWHNIVVHQSEGPAGSALANAQAQAATPDKRGASIWIETDGTVSPSSALHKASKILQDHFERVGAVEVKSFISQWAGGRQAVSVG